MYVSENKKDGFGELCRERSAENAECGKFGVWKMRSVESAERGKCGVWKMGSVFYLSLIALYSHY